MIKKLFGIFLKINGSNKTPAKVIEANKAKFFIHCLGLKSLKILYDSFIGL